MPRPDRYTLQRKGKHRKLGGLTHVHKEKQKRTVFASEFVKKLLAVPQGRETERPESP